MSKRQLLCILGIWIMIFLFLGVPTLWHKIIAAISGLVVVFVSYNLPHERKNEKLDTPAPFIENNNLH